MTESPILPGVQFVRVEQRYAGLPVSGAEVVFELRYYINQPNGITCASPTEF